MTSITTRAAVILALALIPAVSSGFVGEWTNSTLNMTLEGSLDQAVESCIGSSSFAQTAFTACTNTFLGILVNETYITRETAKQVRTGAKATNEIVFGNGTATGDNWTALAAGTIAADVAKAFIWAANDPPSPPSPPAKDSTMAGNTTSDGNTTVNDGLPDPGVKAGPTKEVPPTTKDAPAAGDNTTVDDGTPHSKTPLTKDTPGTKAGATPDAGDETATGGNAPPAIDSSTENVDSGASPNIKDAPDSKGPPAKEAHAGKVESSKELAPAKEDPATKEKATLPADNGESTGEEDSVAKVSAPDKEEPAKKDNAGLATKDTSTEEEPVPKTDPSKSAATAPEASKDDKPEPIDGNGSHHHSPLGDKIRFLRRKK